MFDIDNKDLYNFFINNNAEKLTEESPPNKQSPERGYYLGYIIYDVLRCILSIKKITELDSLQKVISVNLIPIKEMDFDLDCFQQTDEYKDDYKITNSGL